MDRRLFLKAAVTTCGAVVVGVPNVLAGDSDIAVSTLAASGEMRYVGDPRSGCATPAYPHNQHDQFPQDPGRLLR